MKLLYMLLIMVFFGCKKQADKDAHTYLPHSVNPSNIKEENKIINAQGKMTDIELETLKKQGYQIKEQDSFMIKDGRLDIETLKKIGKSGRSNVPTDDGWKTVPDYSYIKTLENGSYISISGNELSGYSKQIAKTNEYLKRSYAYYPSGVLKTTGMFYDNYFTKGTWYWYNKRGQINKLKEYDKDYKFIWEDVLVFMEEKKINKENIKHINREVKEEKREQKPYWYIAKITGRDGLDYPTTVLEYTLDGHTGKIIKEEILDMSIEHN